MRSGFHHIALIGKYPNPLSSLSTPAAHEVLSDIANFLKDQGFSVAWESETAANTGLPCDKVLDVEGIGQHCDLALVVGGDGTMLSFGRRLAAYGVPLIGINQGRLGFITDIALSEFKEVLPPMLRGEYEKDQRALMQAKVWRQGVCVFDALAMNDVVVNRGATSGLVELRVEVDGHFVSNQRADGLIIASPTGSTAYAMSAGGPVMHPALAGWALVPIAPHTLSNRPIVLADPGEITVELVSGRGASANFDMQSLASLLQGDRITVRRSQLEVTFLHPKGWSYFDTLRKKLHWNEGGA